MIDLKEFIIPGDEKVYEQNIPWYDAISRVCFMMKPLLAVEFGVRAGYSAKVIELTQPTCHIIGFEADLDEVSKGYWKHAEKIVPNMEVYLQNTKDLLSIPKCDLILIDADHTYKGCSHELQLAKQSANFALVDDYNSPTVKRAVDEFIQELGKEHRAILMADGRVICIEIQKL